jgi:glycine cleavage system H lipoate-binding protein
MGHDLITIYWLKAVEYVLAVSYLPLFLLFWRFASPRREATVAVAATAFGWADQLAGFFQLPANLFFHPGHTWVRLDGGDTVTIGMSDFAQQLVGPLGRVRLPELGALLVQGEPALTLETGGAAVQMLAPVDGRVVAVNPALASSTDVVKQSPYEDGWLMQVQSSRLAANLKNLLSGTLARRWMDTVCETLGAQMTPMELGKVYLDGGHLVDGLARSLSHEDWDKVARQFFLTEEGGRNA